jgi:hypothetical protein
MGIDNCFDLESMSKPSTILPVVSATDLSAAGEESWSYLNVILAAYQELLSLEPEVQQEMTIDQHALMAYAAFHSNVAVGGFIQLIQNGYGEYLFENPFAKTFGSWGATMTASLIQQAEPIYRAKQEELERKTTLEEFAKMYEAYPDFDTLDQTYLRVMEDEASYVVKYIKRKLKAFVSLSEED